MSYWVEASHDGICLDDPNRDAVQFFVNEKKVWIPRSQIKEEEFDSSTMIIPEWLAQNEGLDYDNIDD
jgi:hypothetical protein